MTNIGLTDSPATEDKFGIKKYIEGLTDFILNCETPMTVSIQGSWGSGKTSIMNMIQDKIKDNVIPVFFNTWQFSQFDLGNQLPLSMINFFLSEIQNKNIPQESPNNNKPNKFLSAVNCFLRKQNRRQIRAEEIKQKLKKGGIYAAKALVNAITRATSQGWLENPFSFDKEQIDFAKTINELKERLQEAVNEACKSHEKEKIVVFIDDLDRLVPSKAMELLEVLKIFFDCQKCVFVLAIDYEVVIRGAAEKYGFDLKSKEAEKGKAFFDKIIQVPFTMPVVQYNVSDYLREGLKKININPSKEDMSVYERLCSLSVGTNPRCLKRLLNAFLLLNKIRVDLISSEELNKSEQQLILFGLLCMQQYRENIYNLIIKVNKELISDSDDNVYDATAALKIFAMLGADNNYSKELSEIYHTEFKEEELKNFKPFLSEFLSLIDINASDLKFLLELKDLDNISENDESNLQNSLENYRQLGDLLNLSATTAQEETQVATTTLNIEDFTPAQKARYDFWTKLKAVALEHPGFKEEKLKFHNYKDDIWLGFSVGTSKVYMSVRQSRRNKKCVISYFCQKKFYKLLLADDNKKKEALEHALGLKLIWSELNSKQKLFSVNYEINNIDFDNEAEMEQIYTDIIDVLVKMIKGIKPFIEK